MEASIVEASTAGAPIAEASIAEGSIAEAMCVVAFTPGLYADIRPTRPAIEQKAATRVGELNARSARQRAHDLKREILGF